MYHDGDNPFSVAGYNRVEVTGLKYFPLFKYDHRLVRLTCKIERLCGILEERRLQDDWEKAARYTARCKCISDTLMLEGMNLSYQTVQSIFKGEIPAEQDTPIKAILNFNQALSFVDILADRKEPLGWSEISELHRMCFQGIPDTEKSRGVLRNNQSWVVDSASDEVIYSAPLAESLPELNAELVGWINDSGNSDIPSNLLAGVVHHWLMTISPFTMGNVRIACLLSRFVLIRGKMCMRRICWFEDYLQRSVRIYYNKLFPQAEYGQSPQEYLNEWLEYYCEALISSLETAIYSSLAYSHSQVQPMKESIPAGAPAPSQKAVVELLELNERQRLIIKLAQKYEVLHRRDIVAELEIAARYNPKTISRDLSKLVQIGFLNQGGARKGIYYTLARK